MCRFGYKVKPKHAKMPKSKQRKGHKSKVAKRNERIRVAKKKYEKAMGDYYAQMLEQIKQKKDEVTVGEQKPFQIVPDEHVEPIKNQENESGVTKKDSQEARS